MKSKKLISMLLVAILALSLIGCGSKEPEILGTYETTIDMTDLVVENFDIGTGYADTEFTLANYLDDFSLVMISEFKEDGTYSQTVDEASVETALENFVAAATPLMEDLMIDQINQQTSIYGVTVTSKEDVESYMGMSWDDLMIQTLGATAEEFVRDTLNNGLVDELTGDVQAEGNYKAQNGKLHLSDGLDADYSDENYETYEIDGNVVTVTGGVNIEENEVITYPFELVKVE